jgi:hypothetical protein
MSNNNPVHTHTAYAFSRQGKKFGRLLECGTGRFDKERNIVHVFLDRTPTTGYTGYVVLSPVGAPRPKPEPVLEPRRPDDQADEESDD